MSNSLPHVHIWESSERPVRFLVFLNHGVAEHARRYSELAKTINCLGGKVIAQDHRGHGQTAAKDKLPLGKFATTDPVAQICQDAVNVVLSHNPTGLPWFLMGHSMGALVAQYALQELQGHALMKCFRGLVLSAPGMAPEYEEILGFKEFLKTLFNTDEGTDILRDVCFIQLDNLTRQLCNDPNLPKHCWLSEDAATVQEFCDDPLCDQDFPAEFWYSFMSHVAALPSLNFAFVTAAPILLLGGDMDVTTAQAQSLDVVRERLRRHTRAPCIEQIVFAGKRHELFRGEGKERTMKKLGAWLTLALE